MAAWYDKLGKWFRDKVTDNFSRDTRDSSEAFGRLANGIDNFWNKITGSGLTDAQREANQYSAAQAEEQYAREVEFYEKYQSPKAMIEQGVNPFGVGSSTGGQTASGGSPSSVAPDSSSSFGLFELVQSVFGMVQQKRVNDAEINHMNAQTRNQNAQAFLAEIDSMTRNDLNEANFANIIKLSEKYDADIASLEEGVLFSIQSRMESVARVDLMKIEGEERKQHMENMKQELANMVLEAANISADTDYKRACIDQIGAYIANLNADTAYKEELMILVSNQALTEIAKYDNYVKQNEHLDALISDLTASADATSYATELERIMRETMKNGGRGYDKAKFILESLLGWWSGSAGFIATKSFDNNSKPKKIGFK